MTCRFKKKSCTTVSNLRVEGHNIQRLRTALFFGRHIWCIWPERPPLACLDLGGDWQLMRGTGGSPCLSLTPCGLLGMLVVPSARPGIGTYMLRDWYHMHIFDPTFHQEVCGRVGAGNANILHWKHFKYIFFIIKTI